MTHETAQIAQELIAQAAEQQQITPWILGLDAGSRTVPAADVIA